MPLNGTIANVVFCDLDLNFQGQTFQMAIFTSNGWKMLTLLMLSDRKSGIFHRMVPLQMLYILTLTLTTANVVYLDLDLDLLLQGHEFLNVNISIMLRASEKCSMATL